MNKKRLSIYVMIVFYLLAGFNHFINPQAYIKLIPPQLDDPFFVNKLAGSAEVILAILVAFKPTRRAACYGIILMLVAFIPSHMYMLETGFCIGITGKIHCVPIWLLWIRLIIIQPLLAFWAWTNRNTH